MTSGVLDEKTIFNAARKIDSPENRAEYLHQACEGDHDLIHRIRTLLGAYEKQADILESPIVPPALDQLAEQIGSMIGLYELVEEIGEGGMGSVYMALQKEPVRRTVALKVIKPGMDTKQVVARFEAERQALAMMDHPNIARVFDGGATESGRPYFAMELVDGTPITDYSDCNQLTIRERLGLFGNICRAVQHAHQKGIIHRDLKPSNILVTQLDGEALPKIIDFGIAKATSGRLMDDSFATAVSQVVGTPMYMSPEQAALGGTDVDTRSDVYSLGVLLYKLLTGMPPFDADRMKAVSPDEFRRIIREEDPPKPSTRLSTLDAASETVADMHSTNPRELAQQVRGELDWIVMKALEKDRTRRYESAGDLAKDIQRYLDDEPVEACPPSRLYRLRKMARRHKTALAFAATVVLLLVAGLLGATWLAMVATDAKNLADQRLDEVQEQREIVQRRNEELRQSLYAVDIGLAHELWQNGHRQRALDKLDALRPREGETDIRGFEWYYLWQLCHSGRQMLPTHKGDVYGIAFSPDGRMLATASEDEKVHVWDAATGQLLTSLSENAGELNCVAFSPDGGLLAIGADDGSILIRKTDSWQLHATLAGHSDNVFGVAFTPDGQLLASCSFDDKVKLWSTSDFAEKATLEGHTHDVEFLAFSPDGKTLATASSDTTVKLWDTSTGKERMTLRGHTRQVYGVAYSHNGRWLATCGQDYTVRVWDASSGELLHTLTDHTEWVRDVAFSPDDGTLASCSNDSLAYFWNPSTGERTGTIRGNSERLRGLAYSSDGRTLATAGSHGVVRLWDTISQQGQRTVVRHPVHVTYCFTPDGSVLTSLSNGIDTKLQKWDASTGHELGTAGVLPCGQVWEIAVAPDNQTLAVGAAGLTLLWNLATGEVLAHLDNNNEHVYSVAFAPNGSVLVAASGDTASIWDVKTHKHLMTLPTAHACFAVSPDGESAALSGESGAVEMRDVATGARIESFRGHEEAIIALAFSPDGTVLASGGEDDTIRLWDRASGRQLAVLLGHADEIRRLAFSSDGRTLASSSSDGTVRLWSVAARRELMILDRDRYQCGHLFFSKDNTLLLDAEWNPEGETSRIVLWLGGKDETEP